MDCSKEELGESEEEVTEVDFNEFESDIELPHNMLWDGIIAEVNNKNRDLEIYQEEQSTKKPSLPPNTELKFLDDEVFPTLLPILKNTLYVAQIMECLTNQRSIFNAYDYMAQMLWNSNPRYPERLEENRNIFDMDWVQELLANNPREIFPKSWLWSREYAAIKIQAYMRGHFVRREEEVQEMRQFWKALKKEKEEEEEAAKKAEKTYYKTISERKNI